MFEIVMASSGKRVQSGIFCIKLKMLIILTLCLSGFCHGKAFIEGSSKSRGKRMYDYPQQSELYGAYSPNYYYPRVNGQPIYIPAIEQSESHFNEFLDDYYKSFTQPWGHVTSAPQDYTTTLVYDTESLSENAGNYKLSAGVKSPLTYQGGDLHQKVNKDSQYYAPEVGEMNTIKYDSNEAVRNSELKPNAYDKPALIQYPSKDEAYKQEYLQKIKVKPESEYEDQYEPPIIRLKYKQKLAGDLNEQKDPDFVNMNPELEKINDYEKPAFPEYKNEAYEKIKVKPESDYEDQYEPPIIRQKYKQNVDNLNKEPVFSKTDPELEKVDDYEKPVVHKKIKEEKVKAKPNTKRVEVVSKTSYKNVEAQAAKKSKGKLNPHISKKYGHIPDVTEDKIDSKTDYISGKLDRKEESSTLNDYKLNESSVTSENLKNPETEEYQVKITETSVKTEPKEPSAIKEKVEETEPKETPTKEKVVKTEPKEPNVKTKQKVVKTKPKKPPVIKEKVVKSGPKKTPVKTKEKVVGETESKELSIKTKVIKTEKVISKTDSKDFEYESPKYLDGKDEFRGFAISDDDSSDYEGSFAEVTEDKLGENLLDEHAANKHETLNADKETMTDSDTISDEAVNQVSMNIPKFLPNRDSLISLSSLNSNILSLIFNPNASPLKLKKCLTRTNETGYCKYVQHCDVPQIATSLEQLLSNACVIDDIFIGVCCPEFPVETVKVHWEQNPSDSDKRNEDEFGNNPEDCGIRSDEASNRQSWPWKAPLVSMSNGKIFCGGVLISEEYVLTAAHCTTRIPKNQILVRLGQFDDSSGEDFAVVEIKRHAQYNPRTMHNDIALLKLGRKIMHDLHTGVICLPEEEDDDDDDHEGDKATLLGWRGIFGTKSKDPEFLKVMSNKECAKKLGMKVPSSLLCTEARNENERTCNADSGAPLVIEDDDKYEVIGILGWNRNDCNQRFPSTFSRVSSYVGWIQKHAI